MSNTNSLVTVTIHLFSLAREPLVAQGLLIVEVAWSHSDTPQSVELLWTREHLVADNKQHSQQTNIHTPGGIQTRNPRKQAATDISLRPRGHWNRLLLYIFNIILKLHLLLTQFNITATNTVNIFTFHTFHYLI